MFGPSMKLDKALYEKLKEAAESKGYSSMEEYATHILEQAVRDAEDALSEEEVKKRLQGLSYLE